MIRGGSRRSGWILVFATAMFAIGCGERSKYPTFKVSGKVTLDGAPVENGAISFVPVNEGQDSGGLIKNGEYTVPKSPKGKVRVLISATKETGKTLQISGVSQPERVGIIPAKYAKGIDQEITQSREDLNFELSSQ